MFNYKGHKTSQRRINMIYTMCNVGMLSSLFFAAFSYFIDGYGISLFLIFLAAVYLFAASITKIKPTTARLIFITAFNLSVAIIASYFGKGASFELILMYAIGLSFILYSYRREKELVIAFSILPVILWITLFFTDFELFKNTSVNPDTIRNVIYPISILTTLALVSFQLGYYVYLTVGFNKGIHNKKQEAINASNAKTNFLSTMSHEIRTPLNAVIGLSHILGSNNPREDQKQNIEALNYSGKILLNLLNNVLDFSKMQSSTIELDHVPTDLTSALNQIKKIHETSCIQKEITMHLFIDDEIPIVWLDIVRYNQVINNLVTNAIKFTKNGSVTLRIKKEEINDTKVKILTEVIDTGIGIPKDKHDTIWEAFTQASTSTNRLYGGTGLGLPIVKNIVEAMGSTIHIDSEIGKGSRFHFEIISKIASTKDLEESNKVSSYSFDKNRILLVEDNQINIMVCKQILEKENLIVETALNGLEAVNMIKENSYDLVLMDIQMPIMDGYTAATEIRKFNKTTPILALSASVFMQVKDRIHKSGMNGFIFKPFDPEDLLNQIQQNINPT
ncbi:response regulator [Polaribacter dokdonensis]|uniref:histidine kinase n=2 Tax=Polaribacter dokdonensis DSW-5 TaxID=1300348 RepID=A0A1H5JSK4_9FLAO|nr:response regulator [Polaribacter dokdonensis]SEE55187.1 Signal transduction histidine kinase [Polaribacter dokdonensis DSW-5]